MGRQICVCLPLSYSVGPLWRDDERLQEAAALDHLFPIEIRAPVAGLTQSSNYYATALDLASHDNIDDVFDAVHASTKRNVRKSLRSDLKAVEATDASQYDAFGELQLETRQRQGSPTFPADFFRTIGEEFQGSGASRLQMIYLDDRPVAGVLFLRHGDVAWYGYGASLNDKDVLRLGANQLAMWSGIAAAFHDGCKTVDFGLTLAHMTDLRTYKERWGGVIPTCVDQNPWAHFR